MLIPIDLGGVLPDPTDKVVLDLGAGSGGHFEYDLVQSRRSKDV